MYCCLVLGSGNTTSTSKQHHINLKTTPGMVDVHVLLLFWGVAIPHQPQNNTTSTSKQHLGWWMCMYCCLVLGSGNTTSTSKQHHINLKTTPGMVDVHVLLSCFGEWQYHINLKTTPGMVDVHVLLSCFGEWQYHINLKTTPHQPQNNTWDGGCACTVVVLGSGNTTSTSKQHHINLKTTPGMVDVHVLLLFLERCKTT